MAISSINTNAAALIALQGLNKTNNSLNEVTKRVNTGYKVNDAFDNSAVFSVAQGLRGDIGAIEAVTDQLSSVTGLLQVANTAATSISDASNRLKATLTKLADGAVTGSARSDYENQYNSIRSEIQGYISNATFNGINLLNSSTSVNIISNLSGGTITLTATDLTGSASVLGYLSATAPSGASAALNYLNSTTGSFYSAQAALGSALTAIGTANTRVASQVTYLKSVSDATETGLGALVDADLAKESARLQSLQIKQQLASQTLGIANQQPSILLSLFK